MVLSPLELELLQVLRMDHESRQALATMLPDDLAECSDRDLSDALSRLEKRGLVRRLVADDRSWTMVEAPEPVPDPAVEWWGLTAYGRKLATCMEEPPAQGCESAQEHGL